MTTVTGPAPDINCRLTGGFWKAKGDVVATRSLPQQWAALNDEIPGATPSHAMENFRIASGEARGTFSGNVFQDSDVAKWLEAASYALIAGAGPRLRAEVDEAVRLIVKAQRDDGYLDTYFIVAAPESRWADMAWGHELYCAGHMIEAAVAHREATGEETMLGVARRLADCIDAAFGPGEGKRQAGCGHPEIELALFRLYRATGEARYRDLARWFIGIRGRDPDEYIGKKPLAFMIPETKWFAADYFLGHAPVRSQAAAEGHSVRAMYLYAAMADEYLETGEPALLATLKRLWASAVNRRMYVTGSLGSQAHGERFTVDWDLPSDRAYAETCASVGLALWASRMSSIDKDSRYADAVERVLYNGILSGLSLEGTRYFYVNPLEVNPEIASSRQDHEHVLTQRVEWLGCSCCPPNIARTVASMPRYIYGASDDCLYVHQYASCEASAAFPGGELRISQSTGYPWDGNVRLILEALPEGAAGLGVAVRIPSWCRAWSLSVNGEPAAAAVERGYARMTRDWKAGDAIELSLDLTPYFVGADSRIRDLAGQAAIQRGPLVYCVEEADNGGALHEFVVDTSSAPVALSAPDCLGGIVAVEAAGWRIKGEASDDAVPYFDLASRARTEEPVRLRAVPYHLWGNRAPGGEMRVWLRAALCPGDRPSDSP